MRKFVKCTDPFPSMPAQQNPLFLELEDLWRKDYMFEVLEIGKGAYRGELKLRLPAGGVHWFQDKRFKDCTLDAFAKGRYK